MEAGVRWTRGGGLALITGTGRRTGPIEGLIFDIGGTLDADGRSWAERFRELLEAADLPGLTQSAIDAALEAGERAVHHHPRAADLGLEEMVEVHVNAQLDCLRVVNPLLGARLRDSFVAATVATLASRRGLLGRLRERLPLAAVSNGCGNTRRLLVDCGLDPYFQAIVDSTEAGFWKPDPRIFDPALRSLAASRERVAVVGDRLDRDVEAALAAGLCAVWVAGERSVGQADCRLSGVHAIVRTVEELDPQRYEDRERYLQRGI